MLDRVSTDKRRRIKHDDTISIVNDVVSDDPGKATLYNKDSLGSTLAYLVSDHNGVRTSRSTESQIRFVVLWDLIAFNVRVGRLNEQYALPEVQHDRVIDDRERSAVDRLDSSHCVAINL